MAKSKLRTVIEEKISGFRKPKIKEAIFENSLGKIHDDFTIRVTPDRIIIEDEETKLKFTPNKMGEVVVVKEGDKLTVYVEKEKRG